MDPGVCRSERKDPREKGVSTVLMAHVDMSSHQPTRWRLVPIVGWIRTYDRRWLRDDFIAGITVAALIVPKNLG